MQKKNKAVIGLLSAATLASYFILPQGLSFEEARRDGTKRAAYVESVERRFHLDDLPYVADVRYDKNPKASPVSSPVPGGSAIMMTLFEGKSTGEEYAIDVYDGAFAQEFTEAEFLSCLIDHEVEGHARSAYEEFADIGLSPKDFVKDDGGHALDFLFYVSELNSYRRQMSNMHRRPVSQNFRDSIYVAYWRHYSEILSPKFETALKNRDVIRKARKLFFIQEFLTRRLVIPENYLASMPEGHRANPPVTAGGRMLTVYGFVELPDYLKEMADVWRRRN